MSGGGSIAGASDPALRVGGAEDDEISLCEALDRVLHKGVVIKGEIAISVAGIDLVYLGLQVLLASMDTARAFLESRGPAGDAR